MNKSYTYGVIALALVAIVLAGTSVLVKGPVQPVTVTDSSAGETANTAAVTQSVTADASRTITWTASDYSSPSVSITVIRKVGDNPARYDVVRALAVSTANSGSSTWTPSSNEMGNDIYIQIGCVSSANACHSHIYTSAGQLVN